MTAWRNSVTVHPLADTFPMMSDGELKGLAEDIRRNGQQHPVLFATINGEKVLIDGRNRLEACFILDRTPRSEFVTVTDEATIETFILSMNVHRRHLTPEDRARYLQAVIKAEPEKSDRAIAKKTGVSQPTVSKARKKMETTDKDLSVEKRTGLDGRTRKLPAKKDTKDEAQDACNALAADFNAAIHGLAAGTSEVSVDERKAQYAAQEATDTNAPAEQLADTAIEPPDSKDSEITALKARIAELETTDPRVVLDPANHQCSFCTKSSGEVLTLIQGHGGAFICDECVAFSAEIIAAKKPPTKRDRPPGAKNKAKAAL